MLDTFLSPKVKNLLQKSAVKDGPTEWVFVGRDGDGLPAVDVELVNDVLLRRHVDITDGVTRDDAWYESAVEALAPVFSGCLKALLEVGHTLDLETCCRWMVAPQLFQGDHFFMLSRSLNYPLSPSSPGHFGLASYQTNTAWAHMLAPFLLGGYEIKYVLRGLRSRGAACEKTNIG